MQEDGPGTSVRLRVAEVAIEELRGKLDRQTGRIAEVEARVRVAETRLETWTARIDRTEDTAAELSDRMTRNEANVTNQRDAFRRVFGWGGGFVLMVLSALVGFFIKRGGGS